MSTYSFHEDPEALYVWNTRVTKALLEDIQHIEVLIRNRVDQVLIPRYGERWFQHGDIPFTKNAKAAVKKAEKRANPRRMSTQVRPGKIIAELNLDYWTYLFARTYQTTIWPLFEKSLVGIGREGYNGTVTQAPSRKDFKNEMEVVYRTRNRCAHHEPIVNANTQDEAQNLDRIVAALENIALWIEPAAASWITGTSRVSELRQARP